MNQEQLNKKFLKSVKNNDLDEAQFLLSQGAEIHYHYEEALFTCCEAKHETTTMFQFLIEQGSDLNAQSSYYYSVLEVCVEFGLNNYIELLFKYDMPSKDKMNIAFSKACQHGQLETAKYLLTKNTDQDIFSFDNYLCLDLAVRHNRSCIVKFLLTKINIIDSTLYYKRLFQAVKKNHLNIVKDLTVYLKQKNKINDNILKEVAKIGNLEAFQYLFEEKFYRTEPLFSSIMLSSQEGHLSIVKYILNLFEHNSSLTSVSNNLTLSSLEIASFSQALVFKHYHIAEYFITKGATLDQLGDKFLNNTSEDMKQWCQNKKLELELEKNLQTKEVLQKHKI